MSIVLLPKCPFVRAITVAANPSTIKSSTSTSGSMELWRGGIRPRAGGGNRAQSQSRGEGMTYIYQVVVGGGGVQTAGIAKNCTGGIDIPCDTLAA